MKVVLPAPFGPISAWRAPRFQPEIDVAGGGERAEALAERAGFEERVGHDGPRLDLRRLHTLSHSPSMPLRANSAIRTSSRPSPSCQAVG